MDQQKRDYRKCLLCGLKRPADETREISALAPEILELMRFEQPQLPPEGSVCLVDLLRFRLLVVQRRIARGGYSTDELRREVLDCLRIEHESSDEVLMRPAVHPTFGQRIADRIAAFGGSWTFILIFLGVLAAWIVLNLLLATRAFDPYPFVFLNLCLSCVAALQAPVIMMSQNRQEAKDRQRAENDFRTNQKAELEIRSLHAKVDLLLTRQWQADADAEQSGEAHGK